MGEPLSPDRAFDFPMDESEPQHAYDFFAPRSLPGYASKPNNMNGWIEADVLLLGEPGEMGEPLGVEVDELMVDPVIDELAEPIVKVEEQMVAPVMNMEENLAMLFGDEDFNDDGLDEDEDDEEVWKLDEEWLMTPVTPPSMPVMPPPSTYKVGVIEDLCTRMGNLEYGHGKLVKKVITMSDAEVADCIAIGEIGPRVFAIEGQVQVMTSQMVPAVSRLEQVRAHMEQGQQVTTQRDEEITGLSQQVQTLQVALQHRDVQIQPLQTLIAKMSSHEGYFDAVHTWIG
ncbi:hypothetical protein Tco_1399531 [Tanacetum coccineum]